MIKKKKKRKKIIKSLIRSRKVDLVCYKKLKFKK